MTGAHDVVEVSLPLDIGIEENPERPGVFQLVAPGPSGLRALAMRIIAQVGTTERPPSLVGAVLRQTDAEEEAAEWKRRHDDLLGAVLAGRITVAANVPQPPPRPADTEHVATRAARPPSPAEAGTGPCIRPGCTEAGAHVHRPSDPPDQTWAGPAEHAQEWKPSRWSRYLRDHGITQPQAITSLRAWAEARGEEPPAGLRSVKGRADMAAHLLALCAQHVATIEAAAEPWS